MWSVECGPWIAGWFAAIVGGESNPNPVAIPSKPVGSTLRTTPDALKKLEEGAGKKVLRPSAISNCPPTGDPKPKLPGCEAPKPTTSGDPGAKSIDLDIFAGNRSGLGVAESWGRPETLAKHFKDHGADFGARSAEDYARWASRFLQESQAQRLPTKIDADGVIRVYDPKTNTFGSYNPDGTTRTFYKPQPQVAFKPSWAFVPHQRGLLEVPAGGCAMDTEMNPTNCPVCGYDLGFSPWRGDSPNDEICLSCGMQFGYYDAAPGGPEGRRKIYAEWRQRWIDDGMPWNGVNQPPAGWDPAEQLKRLA